MGNQGFLRQCPDCGQNLVSRAQNIHGVWHTAWVCSCGYREEPDGAGKSNLPSAKEEPTGSSQQEPYAYVDGSFNPATKIPGYGGIVNVNGKIYPLEGAVSDESVHSMRNVAGEIYGAMAAVQKAEELGIQEITLYYDYAGIEEWALGRWKRNKDGTKAYKAFMDRTPVRVRFQKVKGHSGVEGNEIADALAKRAVGMTLTKKQAGLLEELLRTGTI